MCLLNIGKTIKDYRKEYDLVVVATVTSLHEEHTVIAATSPLAGVPLRRVTLDIVRTWKGPRERTVVVENKVDARACTSPQLVAGVEYLLFAKRTDVGWLVTDCNPSRPAADSTDWIKALGKAKWHPGRDVQ